jgi:hypothetical protein
MKEYCPYCAKKGIKAEVFEKNWLRRCLRCGKDIPKEGAQ